MTYTEDNAKQQYCCDGRGGTCVTSKCMAWRIIKTSEFKSVGGVSGRIDEEITTTGYCGLAGRP